MFALPTDSPFIKLDNSLKYPHRVGGVIALWKPSNYTPKLILKKVFKEKIKNLVTLYL
jgi:hypothetical protein